MGQRIPLSAMSAAVNATPDEPTLRYTQGTSTNPPTGSQTRPSRFISANAAASADSCAVPPSKYTSAAAVIAAAEPHSA